jgi:hypothetical protein
MLDEKEGVGRYRYPNGALYWGEWSNGEPNGIGFIRDGGFIIGSKWRNGTRFGQSLKINVATGRRQSL